MGVHKWRRRPTKYFGDVHVPFAHVQVRSSDGRFQSFALQVDSGAVVSLFRRSVADLLGIKLEEGRRIKLASVGGGETVAYVHELQMRFPNWQPWAVPFAIAETETVPNLLGRLGVFDRLQVCFDGMLRETRITSSCLDGKAGSLPKGST